MRSCISLTLSFHFLSRAFTVPTVYREKNDENSYAKKSERRDISYSIEENRIDTNHICNFRKKKKKGKKKHNEELSNFEKVSYLSSRA